MKNIGIIWVNGSEYHREWQQEDETDDEFFERMRDMKEHEEELIKENGGDYEVTWSLS